MKKTIAMLVAATTTMSLAMTAMASDINLRDEALEIPVQAELEIIEETQEQVDEGQDKEEGETPAAEPSALVFGSDSENEGARLGETILEPGVEYKFPVSVKIGDQTKALSDELMKDYKFSYSRVGSNGVKRFEIEENRGVYYLYVEAKETTPTKPIDVKYNVKLVRKENNHSVFTQEVKFQYGYDESNGDYISNLDKGDEVEIDNARPVITSTQFNKIAKINDYKNVTLTGPTWSFTVNVTDEKTKNMVSNNAGIKAVLAKFPEQEFKFFNFSGKPAFASNGRMRLDVSDIVDDYENLYAYRYADGKLYKLAAELNSDDNTLEFRTNKLDNFVVTNKQIKDGFIVSEDVAGDVVDGGGNNNNNSGNNNNNSGSGDKDVPNTGASDISAAVAAAMAALTAGVVVLKKRAK